MLDNTTVKEINRSELTNFQKKVLLATLAIPKGQTRTYKQIAQEIGKPKSYRAVGSVMKINPFAPRVPCHRVIKSNGELGNYSAGGTKKKMQMLMQEGAPI
ncbi:MAG: MGMT family protein [Candidatus Micrarchaeota archaeon]|nr:MGMT family protein [Candidatus Micrarchaeota archaeon]MDE1834095.1 MGMT family protein [Candidatus Micrarchaeota archaeon]MDE1859735.1 MGMT family protein [Candidatus Micrarchaeota archaeon]